MWFGVWGSLLNLVVECWDTFITKSFIDFGTPTPLAILSCPLNCKKFNLRWFLSNCNHKLYRSLVEAAGNWYKTRMYISSNVTTSHEVLSQIVCVIVIDIPSSYEIKQWIVKMKSFQHLQNAGPITKLWWMANSVSRDFGPAMRTGSLMESNNIQKTWFSFSFPFIWIAINSHKPLQS